jgi:hypothetical protein
MFGSERNDHEADRFLPLGPQAGGLVGTSIPVRPNLAVSHSLSLC